MVRLERVSTVYGKHPERALPLADAGRSRAEIASATGQVLGVHDCSLDVREGEIVVLMGLSGSGKSTLLRAVNGLAPVVRGKVLLDDGSGLVPVTGADERSLRRLRRARVAMVFQQFALLPWRSVAANVGLGLEIAGMSRAERERRVAEMLALVGLGDWAGRRVDELSGGMQQRVGLARAFATDAAVLLMDEPFSALDPLIRNRLQDELLEIQRRLRRTIIFVSHDLDEAFRLGERIAILEDGRIVQTGTPKEIYLAPASAHVADFVANMNPLRVLTAADALCPLDDAVPGQGSVASETPIRLVMEELGRGSGPLRVVDAAGRTLGQVTEDSVLAALVTRRN